MKIPKLFIQYSDVYDMLFYDYHKKGWSRKNLKKGMKYAETLSKKWNKIAYKAFKSISEVSGLDWKRTEIDCFVVKRVFYPISRPLTLQLRKDDKILGEIVHELVHEIFDQNLKKIKDFSGKTSKILKKYRKESYKTKNHILTYAVLKLVLPKVFSKKFIQNYLKNHELKWYSKKSRDYIRAWEIVEKEGAENIIQDMIK